MSENKAVDFWSLLKGINAYDRWLSERLVELQKEGKDNTAEYVLLRYCRLKWQELLNQ